MSLLQIEVIGRLGRDPEEATSAGGNTRVTTTVAANVWNSETKSEDTHWVRVTAFDDRVKRTLSAAKSGSMIRAKGDFSPRMYTNSVGETKFSIDMVANSIDFIPLGTRNSEGSNNLVGAGTRTPYGNSDPEEVPF